MTILASGCRSASRSVSTMRSPERLKLVSAAHRVHLAVHAAAEHHDAVDARWFRRPLEALSSGVISR